MNYTNMANNTSSIVSKVWSFCNPLRDVGVGYGDYLEQLTYLLFLKMADEYSKPPHNRKLNIPKEYNWESLNSKKGAELELHYVNFASGVKYSKKEYWDKYLPRARIKSKTLPCLAKIIDMIDSEQWLVMGADVKGDIYEGLLEKNARRCKKRCRAVLYTTCH